MPIPRWIVPVLAAGLAAGSLAAQDFAPGTSGTVGEVRFNVPTPYAAVPELGDSNSRVYHDRASRTWVLVATLHRAEDRQAVIRGLLRRFGSSVLGGDPDTLDWQFAPDFPNNIAFPFHQRFEAMGGPRILDLSLVQIRSAGTDVLVGSAFLADGQASSMRCGEWVSLVAFDAQYWVIASLLGRPRPERTPVAGSGPARLIAWLHPDELPPPQPADSDAANIIALYNDYVAANREHRRATIAERMNQPVIEYYQDLRGLALYGTPAEVRALPAFERLQVLLVRQRFDARRLTRFDSRELLAISSEALPDSLTAGTPRTGGDMSWMNLRSGGRWTPWAVGFVRSTRGKWAMDPLPLLAMNGCLLRLDLRRRGVSRAQEDSALVAGLGNTAGRPQGDIWQPMVRDGTRPD